MMNNTRTPISLQDPLPYAVVTGAQQYVRQQTSDPRTAGSVLPSNGHTFFGWWASAGIWSLFLWTGSLINALRSLQKAALLHRATTLASWNGSNASVPVAIGTATRAGRCQMRDILRQRVLRADSGDSTLGSLPSF